MRRPLAAILLSLVMLSAARSSAGEVPEPLARWLLAAGEATAPVPQRPEFPAPPDHAKLLFRLPEPHTERSFPAPPAAPPIPWEREYAWQVVPPPPAADTVKRLPPVDDNADQVRFAAGAIRFAVPPGWLVTESDHPRHVRLYVTPEPISPQTTRLTDGLWLSYRAMPALSDVRSQLQTTMIQRLRHLLPVGAQVGESRWIRIDGCEALQQAISMPDADGQTQNGYHLLAAADWGIVEIHAAYANDEAAGQIAKAVDQLQIDTPQLPPAHPTQATSDATAIVGSWKALKARLALTADGRVELQYDKPQSRQLDQVQLVRPPRTLRGQYHAEGDVLYLVWSDGSRLNMRWSATPGELLLTDHRGRVSHLRRLYE